MQPLWPGDDAAALLCLLWSENLGGGSGGKRSLLCEP